MKKPFILIVLSILVIASLLLTSCMEKSALTEKQVIEMTYNYLVTKAEQLQGLYAQAEIGYIDISFFASISEVTRSTLEKDINDWGESVMLDVSTGEYATQTLTFTSALKKLAKYHGDGLWLVSIHNLGEWQIDERTTKITAHNGAALILMERITLKTYQNTKFGYYLDYPPSWIINDEDKNKIWILSSAQDEAFVFINAIEEEELAPFKDLQEYIALKLVLLKEACDEFELVEETPTGFNYIYRLQEDTPKHEARRYFIQHDSIVYEILCSAEMSYYCVVSQVNLPPIIKLMFHPFSQVN